MVCILTLGFVLALIIEFNIGGHSTLFVRLHPSSHLHITLDPRTGRLSMRDSGGLAGADRTPRLPAMADKINENPPMLLQALAVFRVNTILDLADNTARYLGLPCFRSRNFAKEGTFPILGVLFTS
jgi:mediator of RNA polymerase II transcription subunit 14